MSDLVVYKKKDSYYRMIVIIIGLIIATSVLTVCKLVEQDGRKNHKLQKEEIVAGIDEKEPITISMQDTKNETPHQIHKLPVYTEDVKVKLNNIYAPIEDKKMAYLTFDDGPSATVTPVILDILKERNIKATFFVLGCMVDRNPELVRREYMEGHYIANHGYSHIYKQIYSSQDAVLQEIFQTEDSIRRAIGIPEYNSHLFRFPGGSVGGQYRNIKNNVKSILGENGYAYIDWNVLTEDANASHNKEQLINFLIETCQGKNNIVILMHDAPNKITTYEALPECIDYLKEQGYEFYNFYDIMEQKEETI